MHARAQIVCNIIYLLSIIYKIYKISGGKKKTALFRVDRRGVCIFGIHVLQQRIIYLY